MIEVIARAHEIRGNYKQALGFLEEKLQVLGSEPADATLLHSLGTLCCHCGQYMEAIDYYQQGAALFRDGRPDDDNNNNNENVHVHVATANVLIGAVEYHMGNYNQAWSLLEASRMVMEREFGVNSEVVADVRYRQGWVQLSLEQLEAAQSSWQTACTIQDALFGPHDLAVLQTRLALYEMELQYQQSLQDLETYERMVSEIMTIQERQQEALGQTSHPILADTMLLLAKVHLCHSFATTPKNNKNRPAKVGIRLLRQSFHMRERFLGRDHPVQANTFYWLAITGIRLFQKYKQGIPMLHSILRVWKETLGESHDRVAVAYHMLGRCHVHLGQMEAAHSCLDASWKIIVNSTSSRSIAQVLVSRGMLQLKQCQFHMARESLRTALSIYTTRLRMNPQHYLVMEAKESLEKVERDEMLCV